MSAFEVNTRQPLALSTGIVASGDAAASTSSNCRPGPEVVRPFHETPAAQGAIILWSFNCADGDPPVFCRNRRDTEVMVDPGGIWLAPRPTRLSNRTRRLVKLLLLPLTTTGELVTVPLFGLARSAMASAADPYPVGSPC